MNREIKFRGKRIGDNKWVTGFYAVSVSNCHIILEYGFYFGFDYNGICEDDWHEVDPATVGQFTGKKVKTGEVCQDDIGRSIDGIFLVVWDKEKAAIMMQFCDGERLPLEEMWDDAEIIGNLHDNPELLGVQA